MRRDPIPIVHTITYSRWKDRPDMETLTPNQIQERKKWCVDTFGVPGRNASWWMQGSNSEWKIQFAKMEDVTLYLLRWS